MAPLLMPVVEMCFATDVRERFSAAEAARSR
jgi:hypothetical protein